MVSIILAVLPVALQVLGWFLDRANASRESKEAFFKFVKQAGNDFGSAKLMGWGDTQLQYLKEHPFEESK